MSIALHTIVTLTPKTKKGRERIKAHGDTGMVVQVSNKVAFSPESGPWLLIEAADPCSRWVHQNRDQDFTVTSASSE